MSRARRKGLHQDGPGLARGGSGGGGMDADASAAPVRDELSGNLRRRRCPREQRETGRRRRGRGLGLRAARPPRACRVACQPRRVDQGDSAPRRGGTGMLQARPSRDLR